MVAGEFLKGTIWGTRERCTKARERKPRLSQGDYTVRASTVVLGIDRKTKEIFLLRYAGGRGMPF